MIRLVLAASALAFGGIGLAFLLDPVGMAARVGVGLTGTIADNDVRAVYGGLQLGCGAFLALCATRPTWYGPGLMAQLLLFGGLAAARFVSVAAVGLPGTLGLVLHAGEITGLGFGLCALHRLRSDPGWRA